jgi:nucleoside-diphosphate-sugar epimerase
MRILFTGATGVIGTVAVPRLVDAGHEVVAVHRTASDAAHLESVGAQPAMVDLFDGGAVDRAVRGADAVIHFATAIPPQDRMRKRSSWHDNDRLRSAATGILADAAAHHGVERFIQESITFIYADAGDEWIGEQGAIDPCWDVLNSVRDAEAHVAAFTAAGGTGTVLRLSHLYGPGRASGSYLTAVAARKMPVIGSGDNYVSHLHTHDAATALVAALGAPAGIYNVTDDDPLPASRSLGALAELLGAPRPRSIPLWLAKGLVGGGARLLSASQRVANTRFRTATGWAPVFGSVEEGWADIVTGTPRPS